MHRTIVWASLVAVLLAGCAGPGAKPNYDPGVTAADFVAGITNPFLPYKPGSTWVYVGETEDGTERTEIRVLDETRRINGVDATVVRDTVRLDGAVVEDTFDWFAEDRAGNVWYLGEDTKEYEDGRVVSTKGSWEWGKDGALAGIVMKANPVPDNQPYYQEFYWGEAVDEAAVIDKGRTVETPAGIFSDTVTTREWSRLEPDFEENAHYARGVGVVLKEMTKGGSHQERLVSYSVG